MHAVRALALSLAVVLAAPAVSAAERAAPLAAPNIWDGPWSPTIERGRTERFLASWTTRLLDKEWLSGYLAREDVPGDILAEGFHDLDAHTKAYLVHRLYKRLAARAPGVVTTGGPHAVRQQKTLLYMFVFDKGFVKSLREKPAAPVQQAPPDDGALAARIEQLSHLAPVEPPAAVLPEHLRHAEPVVREVDRVAAPVLAASGEVPAASAVSVPPLEAPRASRISAPSVAWSGEAPAPRNVAMPLVSAPQVLPQVAATARTQDVEAAAPAVGTATRFPSALEIEPGTPPPLDFTTYAACVESGAAGLRCQGDVPLGAPVPLDADADGAPDVTAQLTPTVDVAFPGGFTVQLEMRRLAPETGALPAHVFVIWETPLVPRRVLLGFDGRASSLADRSSAAATVKDLAQAAVGNLDLLATITHDRPASPAALTFGARTLTFGGGPPVESDPIDGRVGFEPVPENFTFETTISLVGQDSLAMHLTSAVQTVLTPAVVIDSGASRREVLGVVDRLPTDLTLTIARSVTGEVKADYTADASIDNVSLSHVFTPDRAVPDSLSRVVLEAHAVPDEIHLTFAPVLQILYTASARLGSFAATLEDVVGGATVQRLGALVEDVPTQASVVLTPTPATPTTPASTRIAYTANGTLARLLLSLDKPDDRTVGSVEIRGLPDRCDVLLQATLAEASCSAPITQVLASLSVGGVPVTTLPGDFASIRLGTGGAMSFGLSLRGLQRARVEKSGPGMLGSFQFPGRGAIPFQLSYQDAAARANVTVSNLPASIAVNVQPDRIVYDASEVINSVAAHAVLGALTVDATVERLPAHVGLSWTTSSVVYEASAVIPKVTAHVVQGAIDLFAEITNIPTSARVTFDTAKPAFSFTASAGIGQILARLSSNGGVAGSIAGRDYVVARRAGSVVGVEAKISGLKAASVDPSNGGTYSVELSPGGQPFTALLDLGAGEVASVEVARLPKLIALDLRPGSNTFSYDADGTIPQVKAAYTKPATGLSATVDLTDLPASVDAAWTTGVAPVLTYSASGVLGGISASVRFGAGQPALDAVLGQIPPFVRVAFSTDQVTFDARTAPAAAPASASLGSLLLKYGSNGAFLTGAPADDHVLLRQTATVTQGELLYRGLTGASVDVRNDQTHLKVTSTGPRIFVVSADTPTLAASARIDRLPASVQLDFVGSTVSYRASSVISQATLELDLKEGTIVSADVRGIPASIDATIELASSKFSARSSSALEFLGLGIQTKTATISIAVKGVPVSISGTVDQAKPSFSFTASAGIGQILASFSQNGVVAGSIAARDYVVLRKDRDGIGAEVQIAGLKAASVDPTNGGTYSVELDPGGQPFTALVDLGGGEILTLEVAALPKLIAADLRPGSNTFSYDADGPIKQVKAAYAKPATGLQASIELTELPKSVDATWTTGTAPTLTYTASDVLGGISASVRLGAGLTAFDAVLAGIPPFVKVSLAADLVTFDGRTSPTAAPASAALGSLLLKYASNASFLTGTPADDHLVLKQTATTTQAELLYRGLKAASVDTRSDQLHLKVTNTAPRAFMASADTPTLVLSGRIDKVPDSVQVDLTGTTVAYRASTVIDAVIVTVDFRNGDVFSATVNGIPTSADLAVNFATGLVTWTASAPITRVAVLGHVAAAGRTWDANLELLTVPASWTLSFANTHPLFRGVSGPISLLTATLSNHLTVTTFPGNHLSLVYRSASGDLDASLRMTAINLAEFERTAAGVRADLRMGGGASFLLNGDVHVGALRGFLRASLSALPTSIQLSQADDVLSATTNANFDLNATVEIGNASALDDTPTPPAITGFSLRDGRHCVRSSCVTAIKGRAIVLGVPTGLTFDGGAGTLAVTNFKPPATSNALGIDVDLDFVTSPALRLIATQRAIPTGVNFTFGPFGADTLDNGDRVAHGSYTASQQLGSLDASVQMGADVGVMSLSNVPTSFTGELLLGDPTSSFVSTTSQGIAELDAFFRTSTFATAQGGVSLTDVPTTVDLEIGRTSVVLVGDEYAVPNIRYRASQSTLDLTAFVKASMFDNRVEAEVSAAATNLGRTMDAGLSGATFNLSSTPATPSIEIHTWGRIKKTQSFSGCFPADCPGLRIDWSGSVALDPITIEDFEVKATSLSSVTAKLGITTSVQGTYGDFRIGFDKVTVDVSASGIVRACLVLCATVVEGEPMDEQLTLPSITFHVGTNHFGSWRTFDSVVFLCDTSGHSWDYVIKAKPHPHFTSVNAVLLTPPGAVEGDARTITPNPAGLIPGAVVDLLAAGTSPLGGGLSSTFVCQ